MTIEEAKDKIRKLSEKKFDLVSKAERENRDLNREELAIVAELEGAIASLTKELPEKPQTLQDFGGSTRRPSSNTSFTFT